MCGIAGILSHQPLPEIEQGIKKATRCLSHRGPDEENIWINLSQTVALGHRRLKIIDLSEKASQPMFFLNRYVLIFNGEIYNYLELRDQLVQKGYQFNSHSDAEVLVACYHDMGKDCLHKLDGMFAFAIWDQQEQILFAARDRMGEKPFFYYTDDTQLLFSSELNGLWQLGAPKEVNTALLYNFLSISYTSNPSDPQETFYQNIYKLPPASFLIYSFNTNQIIIEKYWQIFPAINSITEQDAIDKLDHLFSLSIKHRLRSDVSVGTSLSGGLDSSAIVAMCDKIGNASYSHKCFTASFPGFNKDESTYASEVANKFGLEHYTVTIDEKEIPELMQRVMLHQEEPVASASPLAQFKVYELAKQHGVTVLLDGQGADELLAGYLKYYKWYWIELYRKRKLYRSGELKMARKVSGNKLPFGIREKVSSLFPDLSAALQQTRKSKKAFRNSDLNKEFAFSQKRSLYYSTPSAFDLNGALYYNTFVNGLDELLRIADRNSMAHGTEVRLPFLHHELVTFVFSVPPELKIHNGWTKWLLRRSMEAKLPE
ncbi:MAG: asparagine synthase (glutamine-hydrolyzing), partial [Flavisolibacter sp.]